MHSEIRAQRPTPPFRIVYFGTPSFAVPALEQLSSMSDFAVSLVVTQPDRPAGRGRRLAMSPVKEAASRLGLPVYQPESLRTPELRMPIEEQDADLFVVAAYGLIFGPRMLALPRIACVNLHASLLPRYRGASPISAAIFNGDDTTGVSLMVMEPGLDTGPVISTRLIGIGSMDTTSSLTERLARSSADLVSGDLGRFAAGALRAIPQGDSGASLTRPLVKADGWLDWSKPAEHLERQVRAMWPWPRAWTTLAGEPLQIHESRVNEHASPISDRHAPGTLRREGSQSIVACGDGELVLRSVQRSGGTPVAGATLVRANASTALLVLGDQGMPPVPGSPPIVPIGDQG